MGRKWWKKMRKKAKQQGQKEQPVSQPVKLKEIPLPPPCHEGVLPVFKYEHVTFWGGKAREVIQYDDWSLMLCFSDRASNWESNEPAPLVTSNTKARQILSPSLFQARSQAPFIGIDWPDYHIPDLDYDWWRTLVDDILRIEGDQVNVAMGCTGGHGRTGTALAILLGLLYPDAKDDCVVEFIRKKYCDKVVESWAQIQYIEEVTALKVKARPSWANNRQSKAWSWDEYELGAKSESDDAAAQGSATPFYEKQTAAELEAVRDRDLTLAVQKELGIVPRPNYLYRAKTNAAGDIVGWDEVEDVGI